VDAEGADAGGGQEDLDCLALETGHVQEGGPVLLSGPANITIVSHSRECINEESTP
jgi:hypothetical protein